MPAGLKTAIGGKTGNIGWVFRTLRRHLQKIPRCRGARGEKQTKLTANGGGRDAKVCLFSLYSRILVRARRPGELSANVPHSITLSSPPSSFRLNAFDDWPPLLRSMRKLAAPPGPVDVCNDMLSQSSTPRAINSSLASDSNSCCDR